LVQVVSTGASDSTLRHNGNQQILRYIGPPLQRLDDISRVLGWRSDEEEFVIFPDVDTYAQLPRRRRDCVRRILSPAFA
jgi:hypothetical protein